MKISIRSLGSGSEKNKQTRNNRGYKVQNRIKAAAIQLKANLGDVASNLKKVGRLIDKAASLGANLIIVPEFFTSGVAFHPSLLKVALPLDGLAKDLLVTKARKYNAYVGGSFITSRNGDLYNTFVLAMPDGSTRMHDKDQPTMWENCFYTGGKDRGILDTPIATIGSVLCWEFVRTRTIHRLLGKVDIVVGGSCWWSVPLNWPPKGLWAWYHRRNERIMSSTPSTFASILGVPVVHASHAGDLDAYMPMVPGIPYRSYYLGETQIVDGSGVVLARMTRDDGEGVITADITPGRRPPSLSCPERFWIPRLPILFRAVWSYQNMHGRWYYKKSKKNGSLYIPTASHGAVD